MVESQPSKLLVAGSIPVSRSRDRAGQVKAVGFERATIKVGREKEFEELRGVITRVLGSDSVERFLKRLNRDNLRVRDWEAVLAKGIVEKVDEESAKSGKTVRSLYEVLTVSDQAQMREFYLSKIEEVSPELRAKFHKLYQYY